MVQTKTTDAPHTGAVTRSAVAGLAVARAGIAHLSHKVQTHARAFTSSEAQLQAARTQHEAALGRILFTALNQLKGTALKAAQLLSMELGFLPDSMRDELARAHYQVTPLNRALVLKLMRQEFGQGPQALYQHFDAHAFAAASLGQVHAATLANGEAVAVKLQYPGMAAAMGSDLSLLRSLLPAVCRSLDTQPSTRLIAQVMADIEHKLMQELDYLQEAEQLIWFGQQLASFAALVVPQPIMARTTRRVLTMQRLEGLHLNEWLATQPRQAERDYFGQLLWDAFVHCTFTLRRLQADPHPGNYLFMADGRLGLLDFGCTHALSEDFCAGLSTAWSALLRQPCATDTLQQAYVQMRLVAPSLSAHDFRTQLMPALAELQHWQRLPLPSRSMTLHSTHRRRA